MTDLTQVTYCGLYCGLCSQSNRVPKQANALRETMRKDGWEHWGRQIPRFEEFWQFLGGLVGNEGKCSCRGGKCGPPFCAIRKCAASKGVHACPFCDEYPCHRIEGLAKGYVNLIPDGMRMKEIGLDRWIEEQEARKATGFCYVDIRCNPYEVPSE
ncbi:MAG TPA: DUF3795 domain-containing protein [Phycisphaerae bacterium]|nr:DUF3795 domain-containing protein [Phycisphaerae bacterium]HRY68680.1 DUF3795 domain-containing protein [Phycisphaerae bacterium]HSA25506.1 DUF3795 domain-containing protein [Phycisphaerae bacterium]